MSTVSHKSTNAFLGQLKESMAEGNAPPVFLIYGEEVLYKSVLNRILDILVPGDKRSFMYEPFDGLNENVAGALRSVNTYALLQGRKVVSLLDSRIFYSKQDTAIFLEKAQEAYKRGEFRKAAGAVTSLLGMLNLTIDDMSDRAVRSKLGFAKNNVNDGEWFDVILDYCRDRQLSPGGTPDAAGALMQAIDNGFPENHFLIVTTDIVDKRRRLFKLIQEKGQVIDCSVPRGERQAEKAEQEAVLRAQLDAVLKNSQKTMPRAAFALMLDMIGFEPRIFANNIAKLVDYVGQRTEITPHDVETLLQRTRQDPIYSFTNALTDVDTEKTFIFMRSLLRDNFHPLQILAALANHLRKLLVIRDFLDHTAGISFNAATPFNFFRGNIMPQVKQHDQALNKKLEAWQERESLVVAGKKGKKKKKKISTDLLIAPNPNNPYPVYKLFQKAHSISMEHIVSSLTYVRDADVMLKSSRQQPEAILDWAVIRIINLFKH
ncbi:MAG: hypothetical protein JRE12_02615 [Deltaproteobacteria bacterium]|nr:hypothetical protein [Deltaproteobacteria bacterium]